jgi:serine protease Do
MNGLPPSTNRVVRVLCVAAALFILVGAGQCSPSSKDLPHEPLAIAAQDNPPATADQFIARQPFVSVAKQAKAAVVNVSAVKKRSQELERFPSPFFDDPFFRRFFGDEFERRMPGPRERREQGLGSGVIVTPNGYIVTNNHVVEDADELTVSLPDKRTFKATVIGTDPKTDVAVIKIDAANLPVLAWGDASQLQVGELVLAVGNPFGLNQTVTMGIISAVGRANMGIVDYEDFIQTDAAINPGNSGGALVNLKGELIGINTAIFTRSGGYMGIGFAIPSNMARNVMDSLIKHGKVIRTYLKIEGRCPERVQTCDTEKPRHVFSARFDPFRCARLGVEIPISLKIDFEIGSRGWIGVSIQEVTQDLAKEFGAPDTKGALVGDVIDDSPAAKAKLERGDIITAYNGKTINDPVHLRSLVAETPPGTTVRLSIWRDKAAKELTVTVGEQPKEVASTKGFGSGKGDYALAGITVEELKPDRSGRSKFQTGVVVTDVEPDSPAERAGVRRGDIIREINRKPVKNVRDFERLTKELSPGSPVLLLLGRGNATIFLSISPGR